MKQITISEVSFKPGTNDKGPWLNAYITDTEGTKWSVFDDQVPTADVEALAPGDVIDATPKMKDGLPIMHGGRIKMGTFTVITKTAPTQSFNAPPASSAPGMTPEMWDEKDRLKCVSIERQSSAATLLSYDASLRATDHASAFSELHDAVEKAIAWMSSRYDDVNHPAMTPLEMVQATSPTDTRSQAEQDFDALESAGSPKNIGELLTWRDKEGVSRTAFMEITGIKDSELSLMTPADLATAQKKVRDYLAGTPA